MCRRSSANCSAAWPLQPIQTLPNAVEPLPNAVEPLLNAVEPVVNAVEPLLNAAEPLVNAVEPLVNAVEPLVKAIEPLFRHQSLRSRAGDDTSSAGSMEEQSSCRPRFRQNSRDSY